MKKTLIALSLAALSGAAFADVTLYGQIKAGVEVSKVKVKSTDAAAETAVKNVVGKKTATEIADFGSRIGFKGHEAIGNGTNLIWKLEQKASVAGNSQGWATREGYIGVETPAGTLRAGKIGTQLDNMGTIDPWEYSNAALGLGTFTRTGEKVLSVRYDSPVFYGFSGNVQYTPRDNANAGDKYTHNAAAKDAYYAGLNYANAGFFAQYGLGLKKNNAADAKGEAVSGQAHRVEAGYDANNLFVGVGYQQTKGWDTEATYHNAITNGVVKTVAKADGLTDEKWNEFAAKTPAVKTQEAAITAAYRFGNVTPRVSYAHGWDAKTVAGSKIEGTKYDQVVLGADYDFSKRTTAFAQAGWLKAGKKDFETSTTAGLVGLRHKF